jgi:hypothetical protein
MPKAARNTERLQTLVQELQEKRTDLNTHQVDYVTEKIEKGWTEKQLIARLKQTREAKDWQAHYGTPAYRQGNRADVALIDFVIEFLTQPQATA